ncbi:MAG: DNA primase [Hyphomicrobiales bacterium]|nr:MAG: DNA primase [Hyphomicrobiales bacterium]
MRFSDSFLDEIRQRLPITQVVGEHVIWDKRKSQPGRGDMWACCPFHGEKSPSFHADDRKGIYHCFGCGVTGDHFRFLTEKAGMSFPEAVEKLAGMAGVPMPARDERQEQRDEVRKSLFDVMEMAAKYFEAALAHNIGARARGYLHDRQVSAQAQTKFRIGFAPDSRNGLKEHLAANGVTAQEMVDTGLVASRDDDPLTYDRFRNRVMFPITDFRGRIVAFGGRALSADVPAKYLNSPETVLFSKRLVLYNGMEARKAARDGKPIVVVEGYLDVIASVMAGFEGAVAPMGTALTEDHLQLLWRMNDGPILCFDGDAAGQRAAERAANLVMPLLTPGKTVRIATLPEGLDPDDLIKGQGRNAFADVLDRARSLSDVVWSLETGGIVPETPEARAALEARLKERANSIADQSVRRHYMQAFDEKLAAFFQPIRPERYDARRDGRRGARDNWRGSRPQYGTSHYGSPRLVVSDTLRNSRMLKPGRAAEATPREAVILMSLINHPSLAETRLESLAGLEFSSPAGRNLFGALLDLVMADHDISGANLKLALGGRGFGPDIERMENVLRGQGVWQVTAEVAPMDAEIGLRHALALHYKSFELNKALKSAEMALGTDPNAENLERLKDIQDQITTVDGTEALIEGFGSLSGRAARSF